jgi:hypothetical protein
VTGNEAIFLALDLSDLASVKQAADEFLRYVLDCYFHQLINALILHSLAKRRHFMCFSIMRGCLSRSAFCSTTGDSAVEQVVYTHAQSIC